jgi:hypothetical protein
VEGLAEEEVGEEGGEDGGGHGEDAGGTEWELLKSVYAQGGGDREEAAAEKEKAFVVAGAVDFAYAAVEVGWVRNVSDSRPVIGKP